MVEITVTLPDSLGAFVDQQVETRGHESSGEFMRDLIRREFDRNRMRELLLEGANSPPGPPVDDEWFESLHRRIDETAGE